MNGSDRRQIVTTNAAHAVAASLTRLGVEYILVADKAAQLLNITTKVPKNVKFVIMPTSEGKIPMGYVEQFLVADPAFDIHETKDGRFVLRYFDSIIKRPKMNWCDVELASIPNPPPREYTADYIVQINGLPVTSKPSFAIQTLRVMVTVGYGGNTRKSREAVTQISSIDWSHTDESLCQEAIKYLEQAQPIYPDLSLQISKLIHNCQAGSASWRLHKLPPIVPSVKPSELVPEVTNVDIPVSRPLGEVILITAPTVAARQRLITPTATLPKRNRVDYQAEVLCLIAKKVVDFLHQIGMRCALFGSLACYLYGNSRAPNDIDMIVFPAFQGKVADAEKIKREIVAHDAVHFRLETPKDPTATYRVLYFLIDQGLAPNKTFHKNRCKVDILVPGTLHLPFLNDNDIKWQGGLPVVPFPVLLLQKLQGWDDHMHMEEQYKFKKHETDASDIQALLKLEHVVSLRFAQPWDNVALFSREFVELSRERVTDFCIFNPECATDWSLLGFDIHYYADAL